MDKFIYGLVWGVDMKKTTVRLPVLATILMVGIFVFGVTAGAFVYATGKAVIESPVMKMVSNTEYRYGEPGQIIARLVDYQGDPVVVTNCTATILYPNKSFHTNAALMTASGNISGDHYYSFTTPNGPEGTYEYQATCYYGVSKSASVTNSFHLSSALGSIMANQTAQNEQLAAIQGNVTAVKNELDQVAANLSAVNASLSGQITSLSNQLNTNTTTVLEAITSVNGTVTNIYNTLTNGSFNVDVNLTPVLNAISNLNNSMAANFTYTNSLVTTLQSNMFANFSVVVGNQVIILDNQATAFAALQEVNTTTQNLYTYVTTTLVGKVDQVLTDLGVVNATVNRIETITTNINSTTATILQNQQDAVQMSVFSG